MENGMDAQQEWVVTLWTEAEPAAFVEGVGCGTRLEWQAVDSTKNSDTRGSQSETEPVAVVDSETEGHNYWDNCQSLAVGSQGSSYRSIATMGTWLLRCKKQVKSSPKHQTGKNTIPASMS